MKTTLSLLSVVLTFTATSAFAESPIAQTNPTEIAGKMMPPRGDANYGNKRFSETDSNGDGSLSKEEWRTKGDKMFAEIDGNNDGNLSQEEMKNHHEKKRAEWKDRRENRKEEMKSKLQDRMENRAVPQAPAAPAAAAPATTTH